MIARSNSTRQTALLPHHDCRWNNADKASTLLLSGSELLVTKQSDGYVSMRAVFPRRSGRHCFEMTMVNLTTSYPWWVKVGVIPKSTDINNYIGLAANDVVFDGNGAFCGTDSVNPMYGNANGNIVGFCLDFEAKTAELFLNGVGYGRKDMSSKLTNVPYYPALMLYGTNNQVLTNFGETPFKNPMHDYLPWNKG